jgi:uncharacterized protein with GYD domain
MPTYVSLIKWTDQGIKNAKESVARSEQANAAAQQVGGRVSAVYWTQGAYDIVAVSEFPDEESAQAFLLATGMQGNVRTETLRAFSAEEMKRVLAKLP